jgi:alpha-tubulin suppressor-like RCC1 family protein
MIKFALCFLALAACGLPEKTHCTTSSDCLGGEVCHDSVCQPAGNDACGPTHAKCAADAACTDTPDGLTCTCDAGFTGDGLSCADVNECAAQDSPCAAHGSCTNQPGSFSCACDAGFTGDGRSYCVPTSFTKIAAAGGFSCGLASDNGIYCWGGNALGDLGDGTNLPRTHPTQVGTLTDWIDVDARTNVGCGLRSDHSMWCWGSGTTGQLGDGRSMTEYTPTKVISDKPGVGWKAMALGRQSVCGLHLDGSIACWGLDRVTGTGVGMPVAVDTHTDWTVISVGTVRCGIRGMPGALYCWGASNAGDLGLGATNTQATPAQVGTDTWKSVKVGYYNTCGIRSDNALLCWGNNVFFEAALQYGNTPQQVGTATDWQAISLSSEGIIGLRAGGAAYAWGGNDEGQLGLPAAFEIVDPTELASPATSWSQISSGNLHSCGIANGQTYCWGAIADGYLGNGVTTSLYSPAKIGGDHFTALAGDGFDMCGLRDDGALMCWGPAGGIGFGNTDPVWAPTRLGTETWTAVAGGHTRFGPTSLCAIRGGTPYCWGDNSTGELGIGNTISPQLTPVAMHVPPGSQWTEIAISSAHTCAIQSGGTLWCWGANDAGQLGTGATTGNLVTEPTAPLPGTWLHVAVTSYGVPGSMTCGIKTDHTLWCWGQDQPPATTRHLVPTQIGIESSWASLSMAAAGPFTSFDVATTCAIQMNGSLWCWGAWLGDGSTNTSATPVRVGTATDWKTVSVGNEICATRTGGTLWCWGNTDLLGDGKPVTYDAAGFPIPTTRPTQIGSDTDWSTVDTTGKACGIKTDGSLWCWGSGAAPIPNYETTPVPIR